MFKITTLGRGDMSAVQSSAGRKLMLEVRTPHAKSQVRISAHDDDLYVCELFVAFCLQSHVHETVLECTLCP